LLSPEEFMSIHQFNIKQPFVLLTYHPETAHLGQNENNIIQLLNALKRISEKVLCTLPNADTEGLVIRDRLLGFERMFPDKFKCVENLGQIGYYTSMKYCTLIMGNSSSGIIEAASFNKPVVNIGDRQKGREDSGNVVHVKNRELEIEEGYKNALNLIDKEFENIYGDGQTSLRIVQILLDQ
jgi:GDP/UDP-N,N'-diacetylbacillosamine 2-epimerase (hydrolysing)